MTAISQERPPVPKPGPAATDNGINAGSRPLPVLRVERAALPALGQNAAPPPSDDIRKLPLTRPLLNRLVAGSFLAALLVFVAGATIGISLGLHIYRDMAVAEPALTMALPPSVDLPPPEPPPLPAPVASPAPPPPEPPPVMAEEDVLPPPVEAAAPTAQAVPPPQDAAQPAPPPSAETIEPAESAEPAAPMVDQGFVVQAAMFTRAASAEQMVRDLQTKSVPAYSRMRQNNRQQDRFFVYAGPFPTRDGAQAAIAALKKSGITDPLRVQQALETDLP